MVNTSTIVTHTLRLLQIVPHLEFPCEPGPNEIIPSDHCPLVRVFKFKDELTVDQAKEASVTFVWF